MATVRDSFFKYLNGRTSRSAEAEWTVFKSFLIDAMKAEAKRQTERRTPFGERTSNRE